MFCPYLSFLHHTYIFLSSLLSLPVSPLFLYVYIAIYLVFLCPSHLYACVFVYLYLSSLPIYPHLLVSIPLFSLFLRMSCLYIVLSISTRMSVWLSILSLCPCMCVISKPAWLSGSPNALNYLSSFSDLISGRNISSPTSSSSSPSF